MLPNSRAFAVTRAAVRWVLFGLALLLLLTGLGITEYRIVTTLTFGLLGKALSFKLHEVLWIPFAAFLAAHIVLSVIGRIKHW
jgi:thiosulfate reductase cytochrome b subunit